MRVTAKLRTCWSGGHTVRLAALRHCFSEFGQCLQLTVTQLRKRRHWRLTPLPQLPAVMLASSFATAPGSALYFAATSW